MSRIQLVYANFHCAEAIARSVATLAHDDAAHPLDVVVVNNGGEPPALASTPAGPASTLQVLQPKANAGYFGALRHAIAAGGPGPYAFRVLCNPDIEFVQPDFFARLAALALPPRTAVVAPSIVSALSGRDQNPYLAAPPPAAVRARWRLVYSGRWLYLLNDRLSAWLSTRRKDRPAAVAAPAGPIYAPHGALMVFAEECLRAAPEIDAVPFLYAEELFMGEICRRRGWGVRYEPSLRVRHLEHATTARLPPAGRFRLQREAALAYLRLLSG